MSTTTPVHIARGLLTGSFVVLLILVFQITLKKGDGLLGGGFFSAFVTCWLCGPLALSVAFVQREQLLWTRWAFLVGVVMVIISGALLLLPLFLDPDPQNAIGLFILPFLQGTGLLVYATVIWLLKPRLTARRTRQGDAR